MKKRMVRNIAREAQKIRAKESEGEPKEEEQKETEPVKVDIKTRRARVEFYNNNSVVKLNPKEYKLHQKAKDILLTVIAHSSEGLQKGLIDAENFKEMQVEGAKLAIRKTDAFIAVRAWNSVMTKLIELPGRQSNGITIKFQPMVDYWVRYGGLPMDVDSVISSADPVPVVSNVSADGETQAPEVIINETQEEAVIER